MTKKLTRGWTIGYSDYKKRHLNPSLTNFYIQARTGSQVFVFLFHHAPLPLIFDPNRCCNEATLPFLKIYFPSLKASLGGDLLINIATSLQDINIICMHKHGVFMALAHDIMWHISSSSGIRVVSDMKILRYGTKELQILFCLIYWLM